MTDRGLPFKIIFTTALLSLTLILCAQGAPLEKIPSPERNCTESEKPQENEDYDVIDQRQNGTENYRINMKDVVVIWAPADALLAATALLDAQILGEAFLGGANLNEENPQDLNQVSLGVIPDKPTLQNNSEAGAINPILKPAHSRRKLQHSSLGPFLKRKH